MTRDELTNYISMFKQNNYTCFNQFYKETSKQVYFTALGILKDHQLAEEILQETYISFLESIDNIKNGTSIYGYLTIIARNKALNYIKKEKRVVHNEDIFNTLSDYSSEVKYEIGIDKILALLDKQIEREIVTYHVILEYKFAEIAQITKKPIGTVLWIYNKAMKVLKRRIGELYE